MTFSFSQAHWIILTCIWFVYYHALWKLSDFCFYFTVLCMTWFFDCVTFSCVQCIWARCEVKWCGLWMLGIAVTVHQFDLCSLQPSLSFYPIIDMFCSKILFLYFFTLFWTNIPQSYPHPTPIIFNTNMTAYWIYLHFNIFLLNNS